MNVSDYIVSFLNKQGVNDFFGYQGTMIAYFVDAINRNEKVNNHSCYNEQGASFAACGYAQATNQGAVAYSTSGPGAANLVSGVANAYFDSLPVLFITGQINTYEYSNVEGLRQQGFQELDIVSMVKPVTKYAVHVKTAEEACREIRKAWKIATSGRKGAVLVDIPMNIQRAEITEACMIDDSEMMIEESETGYVDTYRMLINKSERPVFLIGNGVSECAKKDIIAYAEKYNIPIVTSLLQRTLLPADHRLNFGFLGGAYGMRIANLITSAKADLLVCLGISLCTRQIGTKIDQFAKKAEMIRIDCDEAALERKIHKNEYSYCVNTEDFIGDIVGIVPEKDYTKWLNSATYCKNYLKEFDDKTPEREPNRIISELSELTVENSPIACDVGQHMMWVAQSFLAKAGQRILFSGGHGAMGYALPAAIGAWYVDKKIAYCIAGDGAMQMNIQELQWIARERLPIKIIVLNNHSLGMIRFLQKDYFEDRFEGTSDGYNYKECSFAKIAEAYGIKSVVVNAGESLAGLKTVLSNDQPVLIEINMSTDTFAYPKTFLGEEIYNQRPYIPEEMLSKLLEI